MRGKEATERFEQSKRLFAEGRYTEALQVLDALDEEFPHQKNVMYPKALCLAKLGRTQEALVLCNRLVREFQDRRAEELRAQLQAAMQPATPPAPAVPMFQPIQLDDLAPAVSYKPREEPKSSPWRDILVYGGIALVTIVVALVVIGLLANMAQQQPATTTATNAETGTETPFGDFEVMSPEDFTPFQALVALLTLLANGLPLYVVLFIVGKLPYNDFWKDLVHTWFIGTLVSIVAQVCCCITVPLAIVFVKRSYDLEPVEVGMWIITLFVMWGMEFLIFRMVGIM